MLNKKKIKKKTFQYRIYIFIFINRRRQFDVIQLSEFSKLQHINSVSAAESCWCLIVQCMEVSQETRLMTKGVSQRYISMLTTLLLVLMHDPLLVLIAVRPRRWHCQYVDECSSSFQTELTQLLDGSPWNVEHWDSFTPPVNQRLHFRFTEINPHMLHGLARNFCAPLHFSSSAIIVSLCLVLICKC